MTRLRVKGNQSGTSMSPYISIVKVEGGYDIADGVRRIAMVRRGLAAGWVMIREDEERGPVRAFATPKDALCHVVRVVLQ
jgi:hypothetical protein